MEKKYRLSIIVPIYNVELYIGRCAMSLINQTISSDKYEVVFVDDGTKDRSVEVLLDTIDLDLFPNYKILRKKNGGLSSARNYGIDNSSGDYIWFVDSDDWIEPNAVELLLALSERTPDIILTTQMYKNVGNSQSYKYSDTLNGEFKGVDVLKHYPPSCAVAYICKRSFLADNHFRFKEGILFEDSELTPKLLYYAVRVVCTDIPVYHHFMREESITHSINQRSINDFKIVLKSQLDFYNHVVRDEYKRMYASSLSPKILELLYYSLFVVGKTNEDVDSFFKENKTLGIILRKSRHIPTLSFGYLLLLFPSKATFLFYMVNFIRGRRIAIS